MCNKQLLPDTNIANLHYAPASGKKIFDNYVFTGDLILALLYDHLCFRWSAEEIYS